MISSRQFKEIIRDIIHEELGTGKNYKIGTIADVNGKPTIRFAGEDQPSQKKYSFLDSYTPVEGDRVLLASVSGTYVVIGKIQQDKGFQLENEYIVERGTNENGEYVRYASGIQICWFEDSQLTTVTTAGTSIYYNNKVYSYPASFASIPSVSPFSRRSNFIQWAGVRNATSTSVDLYIISPNSAAEGWLGYVAIGRWK